MRYVTVRVDPGEGSAFHPLGERLASDPAIERRAIHRLELLDDGSVLLFAGASGDQDRYTQIMDNSPHVHDYLVSGDDRWLAVSHFEPTELTRWALELQQEAHLVVDTPIRVSADGSFEVTYLGTDETFQRLFDAVEDVNTITVELLETGDFEPDTSSFDRLFTARQEEVLAAAVDLGYYTEPRQATLEDIGEAVGIAPTTVGEHLRKVEERVFGEIVD
jgi:predicted DNA binding protein